MYRMYNKQYGGLYRVLFRNSRFIYKYPLYRFFVPHFIKKTFKKSNHFFFCFRFKKFKIVYRLINRILLFKQIRYDRSYFIHGPFKALVSPLCYLLNSLHTRRRRSVQRIHGSTKIKIMRDNIRWCLNRIFWYDNFYIMMWWNCPIEVTDHILENTYKGG